MGAAARDRVMIPGKVVQAARRVGVEQVRRVAFALELLDRPVLWAHELRRARPPAAGTMADCSLLVVVAHWRSEGPVTAHRADAAEDPLLECLRGLIGMPVRHLEIVVLTNDDLGTMQQIAGAVESTQGLVLDRGRWSGPNDARMRITVERWRPRRPFRTGFHLTWRHKNVFRRALRHGRFTHLAYLEDDIALTSANLAYWLAARPLLAEHGLLPGFVRFERTDERRVLVDQTRSGQHEASGVTVRTDAFDGTGLVQDFEVRVPTRPYQACYVADAELARTHLRSSAMRSPLRSNVVRWDLRERAAAGTVFGPTAHPFRGLLKPSAVPARPPARHAVPVAGNGGGHRPAEGALIEHLRPVYSRDAASLHGKIAVEQF